jgi:hypothetical protein
MSHPTKVDKPSEPLGVSFTLGELQQRLAHAITTYGLDARIYGYDGINGIVMHAHFPTGAARYITITELTAGPGQVPEPKGPVN